MLAAVSCFAAATVLVIMAFRKHSAEKLYVNVVAAQEALAAEASVEEQTEEEITEEQ